MPFVSRKQQRYFEANRGKLEREGVDVGEWEHATDFSHLPERTMHSKTHEVELGKKGSFKVKEGSLHRMLGIPEDQKIGEKRMEQAEHSRNPVIRRKAISGIGLSHMHKG